MQAACTEAKKLFAMQIGQYTGGVALRRAAQRKDGQFVWSIIPEDAWDTALEKDGEELGVFLTDMSDDEPDGVLYNCPKVSNIAFRWLQ